ncbi:FecR family protein [Insolitispirillum peregrinum]|uniref:FecR family protein n=1 Tax=Insolitispirillum peregrinum TaxID=80876 RepID=UPI0036099879
MWWKILAGAITAMMVLMGAQAEARQVVGTVDRIQGTASALYNAEERPLAVGAEVYQDDALNTGADARLQVTLIDGSQLTLGENAGMLVSDLIVAPDARPRGPVMSLLKGVFALSAARTKGAEIKTPVATIGIRGTQLWGGPLAGALDVLLLEGKIDVTTPAGQVVLDQPGQGTVVPTAGEAPGAVGVWSQEKVAWAVATVSFR